MPSIDYVADGFSKPGVTILIGGDHGDHHCPISCKINLSSPEDRKQKKNLGYQCPVVQFASIQCSKDAYQLMDDTVMPLVKRQLISLRETAIVVVYHDRNMSGCFRSYSVPSSIRINTLAFLQQSNADNSSNPSMTFAFGAGLGEPQFRLIPIVDPVFDGVRCTIL